MAYFNGFPATYQQMYPQYPVQQRQAPQDSRTWVQGEEGGKGYLVAPNNTIALWDSEAHTIYLKSADASGIPSMIILDYTVRETAKNTPNSLPVVSDDKYITFATKDDFKAVSDQISALQERVEELSKRRRRIEDE